MSTYKFQYGGNKASKKSEVLQAGDYFQLSRKDSRDTILFLFKIDEDSKPKVLRIMGYKDLPLAKFNS